MLNIIISTCYFRYYIVAAVNVFEARFDELFEQE